METAASQSSSNHLPRLPPTIPPAEAVPLLAWANLFTVEPEEPESAANQAVLTAEQDWIDFYIKNDVDALSDCMTAAFLYISPLGEVLDRATYLQKLTWRRVQTASIKVRDVSAQSQQTTAIVTATWDVKETYKCSSDQGLNRVMRVWLRQFDRCNLLHFK